MAYEGEGALDDAPTLDNADDASHGNTADTDALGIAEDLFGAGSGGGQTFIVDGQIGEEEGDARHDAPPYETGACADDGGIFQSDDIAHTEEGGAGVATEDEFRLVGHSHAPFAHAAGEILGPCAKGGHGKIVETADEASHKEGLCLAAALLAREEHLRRCGGFGEGVFAVHIFDEIFAEGNQEENTQHTAEEGGEEYFDEVDGQFGIFVLEDIEGGQGEDGAGHNHARTGTDALDNDVLAQGVFAMGGTAQANGDNGDGDGCLKHLADLQAEVGGGGGEDDSHQQSPEDTPGRHFAIRTLGLHQRLVRFAFAQFAKGVFG